MKVCLAMIAACLFLTSILAAPCSAQSMPPGDYMAIDQYSVVYDNISQFQQAALAQVPNLPNPTDQQTLMAAFCLSHSMIVILDHVSRTIGFSYAASQNAAETPVVLDLMCTHYNYEFNALDGYGAQLDQFAAAVSPDVQPYIAALRTDVNDLQQIMAGQMQQYCLQ